MLSADDPFACIDLDVKDDTPPEHLERYGSIVNTFDSYTEASRSGKGAHIWLRGNIGPGCKRDGIEIYSQERFIICTGNVWRERPVEDRQEILANMVTRMRPADYCAEALEDQPENEDDRAVIARAMRAANAEKFIALTAGSWQGRYPSQSEADMALMSIIAFYSPNNEQCRRIFRRSELGKREKATKDDRYLNLTLEPIRRRQAAERKRVERQREAFKNIGEGLSTWALPPTMTINEMFDKLVYVAAEKTMVLFRDNPAIRLSPKEATDLLAHNRTEIETEPGKIANLPTFGIWKSSEHRKVAYTMTFDPSASEFCQAEDGRPAFNLWKPRPHNPPQDWRERCRLFLEHVTYLVPVEAERERFLDWLAHIEQRPGVLPHHHYLMIAVQQGVGRNWLAALLACVWSGHVAMSFDLKATLGNGFNGQLSRKLLAVVDEINEGGTGERWAHSEKLKSMLTETYRFINVKYGLQHTEKNCCRFLIFSNYETGLPLTAEDRRINAIRNPDEAKGPDYYQRLYAPVYPHPDPLFVASVREYLRQRDISKFNPGARAEMNEAKKAVVAASMTTEDENAAALVESHPRDLIPADDLFNAVFGFYPTQTSEADASRKWKLLAPIARKAGIERMPKTFTLLGRAKLKVWTLRNTQRWRAADTLAVEQELSRVAPLHPSAPFGTLP